MQWHPLPDTVSYFVTQLPAAARASGFPRSTIDLTAPVPPLAPPPSAVSLAQFEEIMRGFQASQARQDQLESRMHTYSLEANFRAQANHSRESLVQKLEGQGYNPQDLPADLNAVGRVYSNNPGNATSNQISVDMMEMARAVSGLLDENKVGPKVSHRHLVSGVAEFLQSKGDTPSSKMGADLMTRVERMAKLDKTLGVPSLRDSTGPLPLPPITHPFAFHGPPGPFLFPSQNPRDQRAGHLPRGGPRGRGACYNCDQVGHVQRMCPFPPAPPPPPPPPMFYGAPNGGQGPNGPRQGPPNARGPPGRQGPQGRGPGPRGRDAYYDPPPPGSY